MTKKHIINNSTDDIIKKFAMKVYMCYSTSIEHLQCMFRLIADNINNPVKELKLRMYHKNSIQDSNHYTYDSDNELYG